jgi:hypothetical protein
VAAVAVVAVLQRGGKVPPGSASETATAAASAQPLPAKVTVRLQVTPPDADVILNGLRVGAANEPISLARSVQSHAIRIEKDGFEAQALWIVPDRDLELPAISLRAQPTLAPPRPIDSAPVKPAPAKRRDDLDLERPTEYRR